MLAQKSLKITPKNAVEHKHSKHEKALTVNIKKREAFKVQHPCITERQHVLPVVLS